MQYVLTFLLACFFTGAVHAQQVAWVQGVVVLKDQTVIRGELSLQRGDVVLIKESDSRVQVYAAHQLQQIRYYDKVEQINRSMHSLAAKSQSFSQDRLFELVTHGSVRVWRLPSDYRWSQCDDAFGYVYFVEWNDNLVPLKKFRTQIYPHMRWSMEVPEKLNPNNEADALQLIQYYNQQEHSTSLAGL